MHSDSTEGILTLLGMGPGDPKLLTLKAVDTWNRAERVYTLLLKGKKTSECREIACRAGLDTGKLVDIEYVPSRNREAGWWTDWREEIISLLKEGKNAVFATIGDPSIYSAGWTLTRSIEENYPEYRLEVVPGIPAVLGASSMLKIPLVQGDGSMILGPLPDSARGIEAMFKTPGDNKGPGSLVFYKNSLHLNELKEFIDENKEEYEAYWACRVGTKLESSGKGVDPGPDDGKMAVTILKRKGRKK